MTRSTTYATPEPLITLNPPDTNAPKSSIYALATDPFGHTIASASPERVVRMWDPRTGKRTAKLVGHTDNIRAILISEDARYVSYSTRCPFVSLILASSFSRAPRMVCHQISACERMLIHFSSLHQTLVAHVPALPAHIHLSHRLRLVPLLLPPLPRSLLLRRQNRPRLQSRRGRLCRRF